MRKDHYSPPKKWTREFRQALKLSHQHLVVYAYLEGGPESHSTGIYFVVPAAVAAMTGLEEDDARRIMQDLERVGLIHWDEDADIVWVPCVCDEQFRWHTPEKSRRDYRTDEARRHVADLPDSHVVRLFLGVWPVFAQGAVEGATQGATQGAVEGATTSPIPIPSYTPPGVRADSSVRTDAMEGTR